MTSPRIAVTLALGLSAAALMPLGTRAELNPAASEAVESYFDFVEYDAGTLMPEQIPAEDYARLFVLDVRDAGQFAKDHIPGAVNIEWRKVFGERAKLPTDRTILVYCNTSSFSGQVAMALRMAGLENVRILYGGYAEWKARGGLQAHARATRKGNTDRSGR